MTTAEPREDQPGPDRPRERSNSEQSPVLIGLDAEQRAAVTATAPVVAILAGAGSGKTRVLTRRIAWRITTSTADARHVLALTFTRKAAGELQTRLRRLNLRDGVVAGTFHAIALAQLRRRAGERNQAMPNLLERKARILVPILGDNRERAALMAAEVASEIEWAKARLLTPDRYVSTALRMQRHTPYPVDQIAEWYRAYERDKKRKRLIDFDDLIWWCADALDQDPEFAAAQRFRFRHLFVDEFQDVTPAQFRLLRAWIGEHIDLCVVGDPDQAIYGFAGADPGLLGRLDEQFPEVRTVELRTNYRSTPQVVRTARAVLPNPLHGTRADVHTPVADGATPEAHRFADDRAEADGVARLAVAAHRRGVAWRNIAILFRTNAQSALFEEALRTHAVPVRMRGERRFLDRPEVKSALESLRESAQHAPGRTFREHLVDLAEDATAIDADDRRANLEALIRLGREYLDADGSLGSVDGFRVWLDTALRGGDSVTTDEAVELLTFHRAKGLEFDTVIVTGLERGVVPITHANTPASLAEERRLLYVALSRAHHHLHCTWAAERTFGLRTSSREPSPYLDAITAAIAAHASPGAAPVPKNAVRTLRASVAANSAASARAPLTPEQQVRFDALKAWRRDRARTANVPAYVIFSDATLEALVQQRPTSPEALLAISGIGPVKAERWGSEILGLLQAT
ncbi:MAG: ATP-dependent helicase [Acidimicrobiia bacterium]